MASPQPDPKAVDARAAIERWVAFGGTWRVEGRSGSVVTVALCRCDGGEVVQRLSTADPDALAYLDGQDSSQR